MNLEVKLLTDSSKLPTYATAGAAGMDLYARDPRIIHPHTTTLVPSGAAFAIPEGYVGLVVPRSGLSLRTSLRMPNSVGVIDSDYRGEVMGIFENTGDEPIEIKAGERFAQMVIVPISRCNVIAVRELGATARGAGGFGSTGV